MLPPRNPPSSQGDLSLETVLSLLWMLAPTNNTLENLRLFNGNGEYPPSASYFLGEAWGNIENNWRF